MDDQSGKRIGEQFLKIAAKQIMDNEPPESRETFNRLVAEGIPRLEARKFIAIVVADEVQQVLKEKRPFDHGRFVKALNALPTMPGD